MLSQFKGYFYYYSIILLQDEAKEEARNVELEGLRTDIDILKRTAFDSEFIVDRQAAEIRFACCKC